MLLFISLFVFESIFAARLGDKCSCFAPCTNCPLACDCIGTLAEDKSMAQVDADKCYCNPPCETCPPACICNDIIILHETPGLYQAVESDKCYCGPPCDTCPAPCLCIGGVTDEEEEVLLQFDGRSSLLEPIGSVDCYCSPPCDNCPKRCMCNDIIILDDTKTGKCECYGPPCPCKVAQCECKQIIKLDPDRLYYSKESAHLGIGNMIDSDNGSTVIEISSTTIYGIYIFGTIFVLVLVINLVFLCRKCCKEKIIETEYGKVSQIVSSDQSDDDMQHLKQNQL
eukprot:857716_1